MRATVNFKRRFRSCSIDNLVACPMLFFAFSNSHAMAAQHALNPSRPNRQDGRCTRTPDILSDRYTFTVCIGLHGFHPVSRGGLSSGIRTSWQTPPRSVVENHAKSQRASSHHTSNTVNNFIHASAKGFQTAPALHFTPQPAFPSAHRRRKSVRACATRHARRKRDQRVPLGRDDHPWSVHNHRSGLAFNGHARCTVYILCLPTTIVQDRSRRMSLYLVNSVWPGVRQPS